MRKFRAVGEKKNITSDCSLLNERVRVPACELQWATEQEMATSPKQVPANLAELMHGMLGACDENVQRLPKFAWAIRLSLVHSSTNIANSSDNASIVSSKHCASQAFEP